MYLGDVPVFSKVDPITKQFAALSPFQFASNRPIDGVDLDGLEYMKYISKFEYTGSLAIMQERLIME
jgi:hypothetical protein